MNGTPPINGPRLLIVDDDDMLVQLIQLWAERRSFEVRHLDDGGGVAAEVASFEPQIILLDLQLPQVDGPGALRALALQGCSARILLMSGSADEVLETCHQMGKGLGLNMGPDISKPFTTASLAKALLPDPELLELRVHQAAQAPIPDTQSVKAALANGEIAAWLQPKVSLRTGAMIGAEALARWTRAGRVVTGPDVFIPIAERGDLIDTLTMKVLDDALAFLTRPGLDLDEHFAISVNISPLSLRRPDLADRLGERIAAYGIPALRIVFEITESASLEDTTLAMETLARLRLRGHRLSLDDFGTGSSSLVQLYRMPFTELKIDRSFVSAIHERHQAAVIVRTTLSMAKELGLNAVAEGVEDEATADWLRKRGCPEAQGYHFGRPMAPDAFAQWMRAAA